MLNHHWNVGMREPGTIWTARKGLRFVGNARQELTSEACSERYSHTASKSLRWSQSTSFMNAAEGLCSSSPMFPSGSAMILLVVLLCLLLLLLCAFCVVFYLSRKNGALRCKILPPAFEVIDACGRLLRDRRKRTGVSALRKLAVREGAL